MMKVVFLVLCCAAVVLSQASVTGGATVTIGGTTTAVSTTTTGGGGVNLALCIASMVLQITSGIVQVITGMVMMIGGTTALVLGAVYAVAQVVVVIEASAAINLQFLNCFDLLVDLNYVLNFVASLQETFVTPFLQQLTTTLLALPLSQLAVLLQFTSDLLRPACGAGLNAIGLPL